MVDAEGNVEILLAGTDDRVKIPAARVEREVLEPTLYLPLDEDLRKQNGDLDRPPEISGRELLDLKKVPTANLTDQQVQALIMRELENRKAELAAVLVPSHPTMKALETQIAETRARAMRAGRPATIDRKSNSVKLYEYAVPFDSPIRETVEVGDFVDFIAIPDLQSDEFKSGKWPKLLSRKAKVQGVMKEGAYGASVIQVELTPDDASKIDLLGNKTECRFHDESHKGFRNEFAQHYGAWRVILKREGDDKIRRGNQDLSMVFQYDRVSTVDRGNTSEFEIEYEKLVAQVDGEELNMFTIYGERNGKRFDYQRGIFRILESGRMEMAATIPVAPKGAGPNQVATIKDFDNADSFMRLERIVKPKNPSEENAVAMLKKEGEDNFFEISIATSEKLKGVTIEGATVTKLSDSVLYGRTYETLSLIHI